ncbi:MAG TPA: alkaline phosphatase family protein [Candidatus Limnocylindrales bacterium]
MHRRASRSRILAVAAAGILALTLIPAASVAAAKTGPLGTYQHLVVIYEENHSFDNLYGTWGPVNGQPIEGLQAVAQRAQDGSTYQCLLQKDVNLAAPTPLSATCGPETVTLGNGSTTTYVSHFANAPFLIDDYIPATATTCPDRGHLFSFPNGTLDGNGLPGGCTRDLVHRFYQEQYQLDGGAMDRYVTGSDAAGLTMGHYDSTALPIYRYLHENGAPKYVIADHFFQAAFGGSFVNHQYLIAAQPLGWTGMPAAQHSILDANGFPNASYPLYRPATAVADKAGTQGCGLATTIAGLACGDYAVNTVQPPYQPTSPFGAQVPAVDDTARPMNIGDELSDAGVSWAWYSGGWDNASGNVGGLGWTNGSGPTCADPNSAPAATVGGATGGFPFCPDKSFQTHHQPFNYFARYAPGTPDRAAHLKDEQDFLAATAAGALPAVSFVKPLGIDNEHPGYASEPNGSDHLVDLIQAVENGPQAGNTLIVVTYDEFGGQADHVPPPGLGTAGAHDAFGPGTRIPALLVARSFTTSGVDHDVFDTTSILATIEHQWGLAPVGAFDSVAARDGSVADLGSAVLIGRRSH